MPEPEQSSGVVASMRVPRSLFVPSGAAKRPTRGRMTPEELRAAGILLNAGRRRGWKKRLALLLNTPETTVAAWATRSTGNARPIPGVTAVAVRLMVEIAVQQMVESGDLVAATQAVFERIRALAHAPIRLDPIAPPVSPPGPNPPMGGSGPAGDGPLALKPSAVQAHQAVTGRHRPPPATHGA